MSSSETALTNRIVPMLAALLTMAGQRINLRSDKRIGCQSAPCGNGPNNQPLAAAKSIESKPIPVTSDVAAITGTTVICSFRRGRRDRAGGNPRGYWHQDGCGNILLSTSI